MKIAFVMPFFSDDVRDPDVLLATYPIVRLLPSELARRGHDVTVLVHALVDASRECAGVRYEFVRTPAWGAAAGRLLHRWKPRYGPAYYAPITRLVQRLRTVRPDLVHFFGLTMDLHLAQVLRALTRQGTPLVAHFHGGVPATSWRLRPLQRHNLNRIARVLFTTQEQAQPWLAASAGMSPEQVRIVLETSSPFQGLDRAKARQRTGMCGNPVYLSVARLHPVKDIPTMLRGFALIRQAQPSARLYLYYASSELLPAVRSFLAEHPEVASSVELRGRAPFVDMEAIYSSSDFLLQASLREWSGLAVLEAMSCGCIPIVSRIPSFASMTAEGTFGRLFDPGDAGGLAAAARSISAVERRQLSSRVRDHFRSTLSFEAMAREIELVYLQVLDRSV